MRPCSPSAWSTTQVTGTSSAFWQAAHGTLGHARQIHTNYIGPFMFYPFLALDVNGKRFCNETVPMSSLNISMSATYKPEDRGIHYRIFDSKTEGAVEGIPAYRRWPS